MVFTNYNPNSLAMVATIIFFSIFLFALKPIAAATTPKLDLNSKEFQKTVLDYYRQMHPNNFQDFFDSLENPFGKDFCLHACNHRSESCTVNYFNSYGHNKQKSKKTIPSNQSKSEDYYLKNLQPIDYIKSSVHPKYDLKVDCLNCQNNTEGSKCQSCKFGYYDIYQESRIVNLLRLHPTLGNDEKDIDHRLKLMKLPIDCRPCSCNPEGSQNFRCQQQTEYIPDFSPANYINQRIAENVTYLKKERQQELAAKIVVEAGQCSCKKGYLGQNIQSTMSTRGSYRTCSQCDLTVKYKREINPLAGEKIKKWKYYQSLTRADDLARESFDFHLGAERDMSSLELRCITKCQNHTYSENAEESIKKSYNFIHEDGHPLSEKFRQKIIKTTHNTCQEHDLGAVCNSNGVCLCSPEKYGPFCEFDKVGGSSGRLVVGVLGLALILLFQ